MISFDYLRPARPELLARLMEIRIHRRLYAPAATLLCALFAVCAAWGIEAYRLTAAIRVESAYDRQFERSRRDVAQADIYFDRVRDLVTADEQVRDIVASGIARAERLAGIADAMPERAWLTAISNDGSGLLLQGESTNLQELSRFLSALTHVEGIRNPSLVNAQVDTGARNGRLVKYTLRIDGDDR